MSKLRSIVILGIAVYLGWMKFKPKSQIKDKLDPSYDYIIVGAGAAGSVIAARLSEDPDVTVAVLEAGEDNNKYPETKVPLILFTLQNTEVDWAYRTVPQEKACKGLEDNRSAWPRGKVLGGSGQINVMWYIRGNRHDYDRWANVFGADGWSYSEVLPYFKKSEAHSNEDFVKSGYHGDKGEWKIGVSNRTPELLEMYLNASRELGFNVLDEINGKEQEGFSPASVFVERGARCEPASVLLKPAMSRDNLHVITNTHVTRVLLEGKRAVGVEYVRNGKLHSVRATKEVILSAGAIGSPHILMLSGIGHKNHLEKFGIEVVADLPVGDNLQDHIFLNIFDYVIDKPVSITGQKAESFTEQLKYATTGEGVLGTSSFEGVGFFRGSHQPKDDPRPYMQSMFSSSLMGNDPKMLQMLKAAFNMKQEVLEETFRGQTNNHGFTILFGLQRPASRGTIRLQSANPFQHPLIDPKYLTEDVDVENLLSGIRQKQKYKDTKTFKEFGAKATKKFHPFCKHLTYDSDDYWRCVIRSDTFSVYHPTSTCKIGRKDDSTTVVDSQLRVHGIEGLRVADASIMPEVTTGNTMAPSVMIGEKAADLIKGRKLPPIKNL